MRVFQNHEDYRRTQDITAWEENVSTQQVGANWLLDYTFRISIIQISFRAFICRLGEIKLRSEMLKWSQDSQLQLSVCYVIDNSNWYAIDIVSIDIGNNVLARSSCIDVCLNKNFRQLYSIIRLRLTIASIGFANNSMAKVNHVDNCN